jgi:hypothetical protein
LCIEDGGGLFLSVLTSTRLKKAIPAFAIAVGGTERLHHHVFCGKGRKERLLPFLVNMKRMMLPAALGIERYSVFQLPRRVVEKERVSEHKHPLWIQNP